MNPIRSVLLLAGAASCVSFAVFSGHALAVHAMKPVLYGATFLVLGAILLTVFAKTGKSAQPAGHH
jgi:hypothetical protein